MNHNKKDIKEIMDTKLDYKNAQMFLHCEKCLEKFLKSADYKAGLLSPRDWGEYETSTYPFTYPNKTTANIIVIWCKICGEKVWDTRHLTNLF